MRRYTVYVCEICGRESTVWSDIGLCEARHLGFQTTEEKALHDSLRSAVQYYGSMLYHADNEVAQKAYDEAVAELNAFELEHNISV